MLAAMILFSIEHPIITGIAIGGGFIGGPLAVMGWCLGYENAMGKASHWTRRKPHPALPTLPAGSIERRPIATTPGRRA
ncbi:hypothetical protein H8A97_30530 [Bradyrhizobium sp. Arg62]|uniref:hypothetical protein n=1 Tax=Bradyrhizobium brasilense TaxID=1419277 RepID=UPI001E518413|nr:hypothetical protein [Bradyrhizobium brasilense]MCC8949323.1 hypothetical protein [Bradyrhizobium brasilense]